MLARLRAATQIFSLGYSCEYGALWSYDGATLTPVVCGGHPQGDTSVAVPHGCWAMSLTIVPLLAHKKEKSGEGLSHRDTTPVQSSPPSLHQPTVRKNPHFVVLLKEQTLVCCTGPTQNNTHDPGALQQIFLPKLAQTNPRTSVLS